MAIDKPTKPTDLMPRTFGGEKNNFSDDLIASGFEPNMRETYNGDNLNYQLDATGKELDYCEKVVDYINGLGVGKTPIVNSNNKLDETQVGLKVYSATETYSLGEWVRSGDKMYQSLTQGNLGNDLTNETYWKEVEFGGLPSQTGKNEKFLKTDGEQASWEDIPPATMLNIKKDLMRANGKKVQFVCSEGAPVTIDFLDGTQKDFSYLPELDLTSKLAGNYNVQLDKQGNPQASNQYFTADKFANYTIFTGTGATYPTVDSEGNASGFANRNGMLLPKRFSPADKPWEMQWCFTTTTPATQQHILGSSNNTNCWCISILINNSKMALWLSSNGTSWDLHGETVGVTTIVANTKYWYRLSFDGTQYVGKLSTTGEFTGEETTEFTVTSTTPIFAHYYPMWIGNNLYSASANLPFLGTIHLQDCWIKIDGEYFWQPFKTTPTVAGNYNIIGTPNITSNYEAYLFSTTNYIKCPKAIPSDYETVEVVVQYNSRAGAINGNQRLFNLANRGVYSVLLALESSKLHWYISTNGTSLNINQGGTTTLLANTD